MIARSDAVSFWVEKPARFAAVEHGMAKKRLEGQYLQLGATSAEAICSGKSLSLEPSVCLEPFLSSGFHSKTG